MSPADLLFGPARRAVLTLLLGHPAERFHLRELVRRTGLSFSPIHREVALLTQVDLITRQQEGRQVYYAANVQSPIHAELRAIFAKTCGVTDVLREALAPLATRITCAFVFGSVAKAEEKSASDVDVMVIGNLSFMEVATALRPAQEKMGREINPTVYTAADFAQRLQQGNPFLKRVMTETRLPLFGHEPDFGTMDGQSLAAAPSGTERGHP